MSWHTWRRVLIGGAPLGFALEVLLRTAVVYVFLIAAVRLLGKRMSGQVTNLELGVMLTLGAIVSVPMESPDRGVVPGLVLLCCIVLLQRGSSFLEARSSFAARLLIGNTSVLVRDGVVQPRELEHAHVSQQQLFSVLRVQHVRHLGEIERVYLEAFGQFSVLRRPKPSSGLSVLPSPGVTVQQRPGPSLICSYCGLAAPTDDSSETRCGNCEHSEWTEPVQVDAPENS